MDERRFDRLAALCGAATSRRAGLSAAIGLLFSGAIATGGAAGKRDAARHRDTGRPHGEGPCGDGSAESNRCSKDKQCCTGLCDTTNQRCRCIQRGNACSKSKNCCSSLTCTDGKCGQAAPACGPATCANGCCAGGTCVTAASANACGTGGAKCLECSGATPVCSSGACVACASTCDCSGGDVDTCTSGACTCGSNAACSGATPVCSSGACVECGSDSDCSGSTPVCSSGSCRALAWNYSAQFGTDGTGDNNLSYPADVFVSADTLTAWVADSGNSRISIWSRANHLSTAWSYSDKFGSDGDGDSNLSHAMAVCVSPDTLTAWVADTGNHRIVVWTRPDTSSGWVFSTKFGSAGVGDSEFYYPYGIHVSADTLSAWVVDPGNSKIAIWTRPDASSTTWSFSAKFGSSGSGDSNFSNPSSIYVSADLLTAWVADKDNSRISIWTRPNTTSTTWSYSAQFGTDGSGDSNFNDPYGVVVSADTLTAWVSDNANNRISIWTRPDLTSTTWSYSTQFGSLGSGNTNFKAPRGISISADTVKTLVADYDNSRISIWALS